MDKIFGRNPVKEALASDSVVVNKVIISKTAHGSIVEEIIKLAKNKKVPLHFVVSEAADVDGVENSQGVLAEIAPLQYIELEEAAQKAMEAKNGILVVLDEIEDPHNLGAIIRNAAAFEASAVIIPKWRGAGITDVVVKASAGTTALMPVARVSNSAEAIRKLKDMGFYVIGAEAGEQALEKTFLSFPLVLIIGSEGYGVRKIMKDNCDALVSITHSPKVSSLNASCAAAVLLHSIRTKSTTN